MKKTISAIILTSILLAGCFTPPMGTSAPSHYYRLDLSQTAQQASQSVVTAPTPSPTKLLVKVQLSEAIRGPRMVLAKSDYEISYLETHRWAEPLERAIGRVLVKELRPYYTAVDGIPLQAAGYSPTLRAEVLIEKLWGTGRGEIILESRWTISNDRDIPLVSGQKTFRQKGWSTGDYREFAEKVSRLIPELAKAINESISALDSEKKQL